MRELLSRNANRSEYALDEDFRRELREEERREYAEEARREAAMTLEERDARDARERELERQDEAVVVDRVSCDECGAPAGTRCHGREEGSHYGRRLAFVRFG